MAEYLIQDTTLDAIADAINAKTGGSSAMTPAQMVTEIEGIETGGEVWELHTITDIVIASSTYSYTLLSAYISKAAQWCYFPTSESPGINSVARGWCFDKSKRDYDPPNWLGGTGTAAGNTAINGVPSPTIYTVNDQSVGSTRMRGNVNYIPAGTYTLKFYGVAK